jgi:hypothetical protein
MPKMLDPFTGHEAKGKMIAEYQVLFQQQSYKHFEPLIEDYNKLISSQKLVDSNSESVRGYYFLFLSSQLNFE